MITSDMLREEQVGLEREIAELEPKKRRLVLITELLKLYEPDQGPELIAAPRSVAPGFRFADGGVTKALLDFLEADDSEEFFTPREIGRALEAGGFIPFSKNFVTVISTTCRRKSAEDGPLESQFQNGAAAYRFRRSGNSTTNQKGGS